MFDLEMIRAVYERFPARVAAARQATGKALTLAEKILYTHLWEERPRPLHPWRGLRGLRS